VTLEEPTGTKVFGATRPVTRQTPYFFLVVFFVVFLVVFLAAFFAIVLSPPFNTLKFMPTLARGQWFSARDRAFSALTNMTEEEVSEHEST
jgi:hypothetical protein